ncbi:protein phosphatase 1 regulatory subunit 3G [Pyxicephalus adspersus]|uniref:protein phosphatase 1 regulatory subunit 3G n=1 Tax=Pyxicephalus adspersus TaxID=30357 RepID=UPI003B590744
MQDHWLHTDMHSDQTELTSDTFQRVQDTGSLQQQCVIPTMNQEGLLQLSALSDQPSRLQLLSSAPSLRQGVNQQMIAAREDLHCSDCQESADLEQEDPQRDLQSKLRRLHLGETNVHLMRRQGSKDREPFPHHDVRVHSPDIRYPEPLATEESPRRRARSLPWNSIPEEEEEDPLMCCCKLKKKVQFADSLGLTLASIKHFLPSDEPLVPQAVLARLQSYPPTGRGQRSELILEEEFSSAEPAPSETTPAELLARLDGLGVCLEQVSASRLGVFGYVLAKDPGETAQVKIRYTFNEWLSFLDCPATPAGQSAALLPSSGCQRFYFNLCYPPSTSCIHFAICYSPSHGQEIWDNNEGANYTINCHQDVIREVQPLNPEQEELEGSQIW